MADDEQFSLCWNNFNSNLSAGFHESLCRGDLVDVTLAAEGQFVKAHRLVLSVCSPYFRKMFTQMPANQHAFVFLKDVSHSALKDLIQFMYCGEVNVKQEALPAFISTAEALQIKGLTDSDPAPAQSPAKPSTPAPQPAPPAQTITQAITPPRVRQRNSTSRSYRIETDDSDDKSTQIVLQATPVQQQQQQTQQQQQQQTQQPTIVQQTTTTTAIVSQKRTAPRSISTPHTKRAKNTIDPLEASEPTQITVQTVTESKAASDAEFIDLPIEMPTKSEPDYSEEAGEVETAEQDATYVEDDSYGDMKYDESYFTEQEEAGAATGGAGGATTSTAVVKQTFVDNSYVEQADQSANEAQGTVPKRRPRPWESKNRSSYCVTMTDRFNAALRLEPQNVVYASTTKGGMKVLYEGHYFKYVYKRYDCGVFQCCYNENNEQCKVRIIVHRNLVYPLDGVHNHYNQATDKSVTSVLIEAGDASDGDNQDPSDGAQLKTISQSLNLVETKEFVVMEVRESVADANILPLQTISLDDNESEENHEVGNEILKKDADDFREKIKKRLQQALLKKKK